MSLSAMITLEFEDNLDLNADELRPKLTLAVELALRHQQIPAGSSLTVVLSNDEQLQQLNNQFLGIDAPTDVLSFPAGETDPETGDVYLGDIIISCQQAQSQAKAGNHALEAELQLLIVHGVLHLLGYDHDCEQEKNRMWTTQDDILSQLGVLGIG